MRVLVTGHKGYIGTVMVPMLLDAGHEVVGLDSDLFRGCTFTPGIRPVPELRLDIRDVESDHLQGFEAVVHLAALSNDSLSNLNPGITQEINHAASVRLAQLAKDAGVQRFLFASSCAIYGKAGDDLVDETAEPDPVTPYNISKVRRRTGRGEAGQRRVQPHVPPECDGVRRLAPPQLRARGEQPRRLGLSPRVASSSRATAPLGGPSFTSRTSHAHSSPSWRRPAR